MKLLLWFKKKTLHNKKKTFNIVNAVDRFYHMHIIGLTKLKVKMLKIVKWGILLYTV